MHRCSTPPLLRDSPSSPCLDADSNPEILPPSISLEPDSRSSRFHPAVVVKFEQTFDPWVESVVERLRYIYKTRGRTSTSDKPPLPTSLSLTAQQYRLLQSRLETADTPEFRRYLESLRFWFHHDKNLLDVMPSASAGHNKTARKVMAYIIELATATAVKFQSEHQDLDIDTRIFKVEENGDTGYSVKGPVGRDELQADASLRHEDRELMAQFPSVLVEVSRTEALATMRAKLHRWVVGTKGEVRVAIGIKVPYEGSKTRPPNGGEMRLVIRAPRRTDKGKRSSRTIVDRSLTEPPFEVDLLIKDIFHTNKINTFPDFGSASITIKSSKILEIVIAGQISDLEDMELKRKREDLTDDEDHSTDDEDWGYSQSSGFDGV